MYEKYEMKVLTFEKKNVWTTELEFSNEDGSGELDE